MRDKVKYYFLKSCHCMAFLIQHTSSYCKNRYLCTSETNRLIFMIPTRTFDYLDILNDRFQKDDIFARCQNGKWHKVSVQEYIEKSHSIARGFLALGYQPDDKVIVITPNRPEWNFLDMGTTLAGLVFVPVYPTLSHDEFLYILNHSDSKAIFAGSERLYKILEPIMSEMDHKADLYLIDDSNEKPCLANVIEAGMADKDKYEDIIKKNIKETNPDTVASLVYTSGTTGTPKGVMLTHRNLTFNAHSHAVRQTYTEKHRMLSFLPLCHVYERTMNYEYQEKGISTYYAEGLKSIARDMESSHADGLCAVPRVLESMFENFDKAGRNLTGFAKKIYDWCWEFGINFDNRRHNPIYALKHTLADRLVYRKWREKLGGHRLLVVSGGSSIRPQIVKLFNAAHMYIYEGYGMTEASPVIAVNSPADGYNIIGTVGKPIGGSELTFAPDGEILTRGPHVMKGYYKNPEATAEVIDSDGWLHTGDIGTLVEGMYVKITDRKKEIFKLSLGKYIAPQALETQIINSPFFDNCFVFGNDHKFASAVITVNKEKARELAKELDIEFKSDDTFFDVADVRSRLIKDVDAVNKLNASFEAIIRPIFTFDEWSTANGLLSQTLKLKRKALMERYGKAIAEKVYND